MLTFFSTAKAFQGHSAIIQRNALQSWKLLHADVEVILFGDDPGAAEVCVEFGLRHHPEIERHESGMKYLHFMFDRARSIARHDFLCYLNCDILLLPDFWNAFQILSAWKKEFLMIGQRWDTDVTQPVDFTNRDWAKEMRRFVLTHGARQPYNFVDFFLFARPMYGSVPPLVVGRSFWDLWLVWKALDSGAPVVDATRFVVPVHQNHDYGYHPLGKHGTNVDPLAMRNLKLAGDGQHQGVVTDATHRLTAGGKIRRTPLRRYLGGPSALHLRQKIVEATFPLRKRLALRRSTLREFLGKFHSRNAN